MTDLDGAPVRFVPAWFPGAQFKRDAKRWRDHCADLRKVMIDGVERRMVYSSISNPSGFSEPWLKEIASY